MSESPLCAASTLAKLFVLSERRIRQLASTGIIPKAQDGQYQVMGAVRAYVLFLRERTRSNTDPEAALLAHERLRLLKTRADLADHELQVVRQQWVEVTQVNEMLDALGAVFTACVDALPGRLAAAVTGTQDAGLIKAQVFAACRQLRNTTGEQLDRLSASLRRHEALSSEDSGSSATNTGSMGRCTPEPASRECRTGALAEPAGTLHDSDCAGLSRFSLQAGDCGDGEPDG